MAPTVSIGFSDVLLFVLVAAVLLYFVPMRLRRSLRSPPAAQSAYSSKATSFTSTSAVPKSN
jgi:hypothetical protein